MKCWIDTQSVKNVIDITTIEENTLEKITKDYLANLTGKYHLNEKEFASKLTEIERENDNGKKITLINGVIDKIFDTNEKAYSLLLRGNAFAELARLAYNKNLESEITIEGKCKKDWRELGYKSEGHCIKQLRLEILLGEETSGVTTPSEEETSGEKTTTETPTEIPNQEVSEYKCEEGKRIDYTCQFVCPGEKVSCVCENENWKCGQCESKCAGTAGKTENETVNVEAADMGETGIYQCEESKKMEYTCQSVCIGKTVSCECNGGNWRCEQCESKCSNTAGKTENEASGVLVNDVKQIKEVPTAVKKTYRIDRVGFKIGSQTTYDQEILRTGAVELIVDSADNCQWIKYMIWREGALAGLFDVKIGEDTSLDVINRALNLITKKGKYHVDVLCFNPEGKSTKIISKNLEVR